MHEHFLVRHTTLVGIDAEALEKAERGLERAQLQSYAMSAEEWALTYAKGDQYDLTRPLAGCLSRSEFGEQLQQPHLSELECFEFCFVTVAHPLGSGAVASVKTRQYLRQQSGSPCLPT